jgi:PKD repeat protein
VTFGDGTSASGSGAEIHLTHSYDSLGTFTATLTVQGDGGNDSQQVSVEVRLLL